MGPLQCLYFFYRNSESSVNISYLNIRPSQEHIGFPFCFKLAVLCSLGVDKLFEVQSGWLFWVSCSTNSGRGRHCWTRTCSRSKGTCSETTEIYKISTHISFLLRIVRPPTPRGNWRRDQLLTYHRKNKFKMISEIKDRFSFASIRSVIGPQKFTPHPQPIRCKTKTTRDLVARDFPRFRPLSCFYFEFLLALKSIFLSSNWSLWLIWFGFDRKALLGKYWHDIE